MLSEKTNPICDALSSPHTTNENEKTNPISYPPCPQHSRNRFRKTNPISPCSNCYPLSTAEKTNPISPAMQPKEPPGNPKICKNPVILSRKNKPNFPRSHQPRFTPQRRAETQKRPKKSPETPPINPVFPEFVQEQPR